MPRHKDETLTLRTTAKIEGLLRQAAKPEPRSVAAMIKVLVLAYAREHELTPQKIVRSRRKRLTRCAGAAFSAHESAPRIPSFHPPAPRYGLC
jgi:hypothetical protein